MNEEWYKINRAYLSVFCMNGECLRNKESLNFSFLYEKKYCRGIKDCDATKLAKLHILLKEIGKFEYSS